VAATHEGRNMTVFGSSPKALLESHGLRAKRHFGQNFLSDTRLAARIAEWATTPAGGTVVEIGAGLGALTRPLLDRAARVLAIERDRDLVAALQMEFAAPIAQGRMSLVEADAKTVDLASLFRDTPRPRVLAGNLPYQITGPLLEKTAASRQLLQRAVLMVQLEVGDRIAAEPGTASYGALSVFIQAQYRTRRALVVRRGAFYPQPRVDSAVVLLDPLSPPIAEETAAFRSVVKAAFAQRRKKLRNAWSGVLTGSVEELAAAARRAGVDLDARGESLTVEQFARMAAEVQA
jgi:16S rRNA (adenine1518-N6/adenine1519-N6)-dimethyltransferase